MICDRCGAVRMGLFAGRRKLCGDCMLRDYPSEAAGAPVRSQWCSNCKLSGHSAWACALPNAEVAPKEKQIPRKSPAPWWSNLQVQVERQGLTNRLAGRYGAI